MARYASGNTTFGTSAALLGLKPQAPEKGGELNVANRQRNCTLQIRLSPEEKELFKEQFKKSKYPGQADFLMALLDKKPIVVIEDLKTVTTELRRQGRCV